LKWSASTYSTPRVPAYSPAARIRVCRYSSPTRRGSTVPVRDPPVPVDEVDAIGDLVEQVLVELLVHDSSETQADASRASVPVHGCAESAWSVNAFYGHLYIKQLRWRSRMPEFRWFRHSSDVVERRHYRESRKASRQVGGLHPLTDSLPRSRRES
jgi:hypothetical protein